MASNASDLLKLELQTDGENDSTWGQLANILFERTEQAIGGITDIALTSSNYTLDDTQFVKGSGTTAESHRSILSCTGTLTANVDVIVPARTKIYAVKNATSGAFTVTVKTSAGSGVAITQGNKAFVFCDGTNVELITEEYTAAERTKLAGIETAADVTDAANVAAAGAAILVNTQTFTKAQNWTKGSNIVCADPLVIGTTGNYNVATGNTNFASMTVAAGRLFMVQYTGTPTITDGAPIDLPGGVDITVVAGDRMICFSTAANTVDVVSYTRADGTAVAGGQPGLVLISTASASNDATVDFTGLDDTYDKYILEINSLVPQTNATTLYARVAESGPSWKSGASDYRWALGSNIDTPTAFDTGSAADSEIEISRASVGNAAGRNLNATVTISNPDSTSLNKVIKFDADLLSDIPRAERVTGAGVYVGTTNAIVGIRFLMSSGNITSGEFRLYGMRKS